MEISGLFTLEVWSCLIQVENVAILTSFKSYSIAKEDGAKVS